MIFRALITLLLLYTSVTAGDITKIWPKGVSETLTYNINVYTPKKVTNGLTVSITRLDTTTPVFETEQTIDIINQEIKMQTEERFEGDSLILTKSNNLYVLTPDMAKKMGADSIEIRAFKDGDSLKIRSNYTGAMPGAMPYYDGLTTTTGTLLTARNKDFKPGYRNEYAFVNLLFMTGKPYQAIPAADSVIDLETVTVPAGTFECYKVRNDAVGAYGYSYFTKDGLHTPVKTVMLDNDTGKPVTELILMNREQKNP